MTLTANHPLQDNATLMALLESWAQLGWLRALDLALARFLLQQAPDASAELLLASALVSHQLGRGHVCLWLEGVLADPYMALSLPPERGAHELEQPVWLPSDLLRGLNIDHWRSRLNHPQLVGNGVGNTPLVFDGDRLYLRRYWQYERSVETAIAERLKQCAQIQAALPGEFADTLQSLFPANSGDETDWQKIACALAARSAFCIITGGPGTGKTTTVIKLLALLQSLALQASDGTALRIKLAAPTGKAAARLKESIAAAIDRLPAQILTQSGLRPAIPTEVITLHRLLGSRPHSRRFQHDARNPLALDVLVVDEASMVDLELMAALLAALAGDARLVLLGDKDQLASVEAGSVLGQLCSQAKFGRFNRQTVEWLQAVAGGRIAAELIDEDGRALDQQLVMLRKSHRFTADSGIGQLASGVNSGDPAAIDAVWRQGYADLNVVRIDQLQQPQFRQIIIGPSTSAEHTPQGYGHYLNVINSQRPPLHADAGCFDDWARAVLNAHSQFQLLCALRSGPYGVDGLNQWIADILQQQGLIQSQTVWYAGRPVLVTKNDYRLGLMNGDIGIALPYPIRDRSTGHLDWKLRVAFPKSDGNSGINWLLPSRLLAVETVFALTVHKSQGSEFAHTALVLPPKLNPILTRELVYTGITRAKKWFSLIDVGGNDMIKQAAARVVLRSGGLFVSDSSVG